MVIDFNGNHRSSLFEPRTLLSLAARSRQILSGDPLLAVDVGENLGDTEAVWNTYWRR